MVLVGNNLDIKTTTTNLKCSTVDPLYTIPQEDDVDVDDARAASICKCCQHIKAKDIPTGVS
uniref:Uncharacterized protein n=1 Tax=Glossina austeni TaxID=7395 RepID=A0A1A9VHA4_GLOAU